MPINASIPLGVQPMQIQQPDPNSGMNALARIMQLRGMQQESELGRMKVDEYKRGIEDQNALRSALSAPGADPYNVLLQRGRVKEATEFQTGQANAAKVKTETESKQLEMAHKRVDSWGQAMGFVRQNPTPQNAQAAVQHLVTMGIIPPQQAQAAMASAGSDPQAISQWAEMGFRAALGAKEQLPKFQTNNIGGSTPTQAIDPVTGQTRIVSNLQNTASPGEVLTDQRQRTQFAETQRHNRTMEGFRSQEVAAPRGVLDPERGLLVDPRTGQARPVTVNGQPVDPKLSESVKKELTGINQQRSIIDGAIAAVDQTPSAFTFMRGTATMAGAIPESLAGRADSDPERQARSYVFNNVSKVINERAGAAQSAQELARLRSFLPAETDNADQIKSKLQAFKTYLGDMEAGTRGKPVGPKNPTAPTKPSAAFSDPDKESRYQQWKRQQGGKQ